MINLEVQPYCENCTDFDARIEKYKVDLAADGWEGNEHGSETVISCKYRKRCEGIYRYLRKQLNKEEGTNNGTNETRVLS